MERLPVLNGGQTEDYKTQESLFREGALSRYGQDEIKVLGAVLEEAGTPQGFSEVPR